MKRLFLFVALAVVATAAVPVLAGAAPKFEKANGTGQSASYGSVHVNAKDQGDGPRGHFFVGTDIMQGDVTCIRQQGNTALIGGTLRDSGMPILIEVVDNGQPGAGADQHRWRPASPNEVAPPDCEDFGNNPPRATIEQGNYVVPSGDGG
jgi:hypothetical protein